MKHVHRNRIFASLVATSAMLWSAQTSAVVSTGSFDVSLTLVPGCAVQNTTTLTFGSYTAITGSAATSTGGGFDITCTNHLYYNVSLDGTPTAGVYSYTDNAVDLAYTLTLKSGATTITPTTSRNGTAAAQAYTFDGSIAAGQAGRCNGTNDFTAVTGGGAGANTTTCTNTASTNKTRTITVTY